MRTTRQVHVIDSESDLLPNKRSFKICMLLYGLRSSFRSPKYWRSRTQFMSGITRIKPTASSRVVPPDTMTIELTDAESQVCTLLDECTQHLKDEKGLITSCRIAGGWVRDKVGSWRRIQHLYPYIHFCPQLLGSQSNDIDIALEDMMGVAFAEHFVQFVSSKKDLPVKTVAKIERNPDQSKHLETARTTVLGTELDFVNLRSEEYAGDSRIPTDIVSARSAPFLA